MVILFYLRKHITRLSNRKNINNRNLHNLHNYKTVVRILSLIVNLTRNKNINFEQLIS